MNNASTPLLLTSGAQEYFRSVKRSLKTAPWFTLIAGSGEILDPHINSRLVCAYRRKMVLAFACVCLPGSNHIFTYPERPECNHLPQGRSLIPAELSVSSVPEVVTHLLLTSKVPRDRRAAASFALPPTPSMEAIAKFDFTASGEDELSFQAGDMLKVLSSQEDWYKAELRSQEGYVPKNFIDFHVPPWFDERISRHEAENLLMSKGVGCFIVRASQNSHGDFSISVRHEDDVQHFKVMRDSKGSYYLWTEKFHSLNKLVDYYKTTSISRQKQIFLRDNSQEEKERRGGSLERIGQEGFHLGGAVGEDHSSISKRYVEHPIPILQQQQERYGGSLDRKDVLHGLRDHGQGSAGAMQRRHTDPLHQQTPRTLWVRALYDFDAMEHDELGFRSGDILEVLDSSNPSWWKGRLRGELGLFPANYVTPVLL